MTDTPKVLLVEDYAANVLVATTYLEMFGYACDVASNGVEAAEKAKSGEYFAILMDIEMEGMNGLDATRAIREDEAATGRKPVHIVGMSAHAGSSHRERALEAGMDDYLPKPFNPDDFEDKLAELAKQHIA